MTAGHCYTGKHCHRSPGAAEAQLRSLFKADGIERVAYKCPKCRYWHVGRKRKYRSN